jgi:hypothetical protein
MPSNYESIYKEHQLDYGRKLTVWAQDHLANRYTDRTHFIFELLQNAEDALQERGESHLSTSVAFNLQREGLEVRHFGRPFTPDNVKSICAINESTKKDELTEIGRFGIGFKSVYAFTRRPEVHSGDEHFAIEKFVLPVAVTPKVLKQGETLFWIPFSESDTSAVDEVSSALRTLGSRRLLFLKGINEITWSLPNGTHGVFLRNQPIPSEDGELINLLGEVTGEAPKEEEWLLFSRPVKGPGGRPAGYVAIGFLLNRDLAGKRTVREVPDSRLVVFFPTDVLTGTGFLIQGPYRTTPSRDNVPLNDSWNRRLLEITADLLVGSLRSLRNRGLLQVDALEVLPIDHRLFRTESMFFPLFERVREALKSESLLPAFDGSHVPGIRARLARSEAIRELLSPSQLAQLLGVKPDVFWLSDEITKDRAAGLRDYLIQQVGIGEITPDYLQSRLNVAFLTVQTDEWICRFYEFLSGQKALLRDILRRGLQFIRCEDGTHVPPTIGRQPQVFLPSEGVTGFRTVKRSVCTPSVVEFLQQIGLSKPDPVDDVIQNVLRFYKESSVSRPDTHYASDLRRILSAFRTDSDQGRRKLVEALGESYFVRAVAPESGSVRFLKPGQTYRSTQRLRIVFEGIANVWLVDDSCSALKGEAMRELLQACGAFDVLRTLPCRSPLTWEEKKKIRLREGNEAYSSEWVANDSDCPELEYLLEALPQLTPEDLKKRSFEFWLLLRDTLHDRREAYFQATYRWSYMRRDSSCVIPATWIRRLQRNPWIADLLGVARAPHEICLSDADRDIQSSPNAFLTEILGFRPEAIKELAEKEGIDLEALNLLKQHNISAAQLRELIGTQPEEDEDDFDSDNKPHDAELENAAKPEDDGHSEDSDDAEHDGEEEPTSQGFSGGGVRTDRRSSGGVEKTGVGKPQQEFHTYVGVNYDRDLGDNDELHEDERREIEEAAICFIVQREPLLERTPTNNPGFDLFEGESLEYPVRFVEVKAKKGEWNGMVALSEDQFRVAENERERFWLYIVEFAQDTEKRRLYRVQDPAGKTRYFTFDSGWKSLAEQERDESQREVGTE